MKHLFTLFFIPFLFIGCSSDKKGKFRNGMATIQDQSSNKYGYINENNELVIDKKYNTAGDFSSLGFAIVGLHGKKGLINKKGEIAIPFIYDRIMHLEDNYFEVVNNGKSGVYNSKNQEIIPVVAIDIIEVHNGKYFEVKLNQNENSVCFFNNKGKQVTKAKFSDVFKVVNNYAIMQIGKKVEYSTNPTYKIYDLDNPNNPINKLKDYYKIKLINPSNENHKLLFQIRGGLDKNAVSDYMGNMVIPFGKYYSIWEYGEGLFSVSVQGMRNGYADKNGKLVIKPIFEKAGKFENGKARVTLKGKVFYIDKNGNCIEDCPTQKWLNFHNLSDFKINKLLYAQLIEKGLLKSKQEKYAISIEIFTKAIEENPMDYEAYHNRGLSYLMINKLDEALQDFDKSIQFNPTFSDSYYLRGDVYKRRGSSFSAIRDFEKAIELNPDNPDPYMQCAIVYGRQGNKQKSCQYIRKACDLGSYDACSGYSRFCE